MKSTKSPAHYEDYHNEHDSEETTTEQQHHDDDEAESDEDHTHSEHGGEEFEDNTENVALDERHGDEEEDIPVEQKLRKLTDNISHLGAISSNDNENRQSFLSLTDLIKTLRPDEAHRPVQTDSSYSRSQALGEMPDIVFHPRKTTK